MSLSKEVLDRSLIQSPAPVTERPNPIAVSVASTEAGEEFYLVGRDGVTAMRWGEINGSMAPIATIQVFKGDKLFAEAPFINCESVRYFDERAPFA